MRAVLLFLMLAMLGCMSPLASLERSLIYHGQPDASFASKQDVYFQSADGVRLHGKLFEADNRQAIILFCHGNAGSVETWSDSAIELQQRQCTVFLFDYRGYGKSEGSPSEQGVLSDARAARRWLASHCNIREQDIVLLGRSLGGGVAVDLASRDGARGLILQNTFTSLPDVAAYHVPWLLPRWLMSEQFDSLTKIKSYHGPVLQCHGERDTLIPMEQARRLFEAAPGKKTFVSLPHAGHNDPLTESYFAALVEFLQQLPRQHKATSPQATSTTPVCRVPNPATAEMQSLPSAR